MPQVKIYGLKENLEAKRLALSEAIHSALMAAIGTPAEKRFQRFIALEAENFIFPSDRTNSYTIIEISMFEGHSVAAKKKLIELLYRQINEITDITPQDLEITILETPSCNWGIRGMVANELKLNYKINV